MILERRPGTAQTTLMKMTRRMGRKVRTRMVLKTMKQFRSLSPTGPPQRRSVSSPRLLKQSSKPKRRKRRKGKGRKVLTMSTKMTKIHTPLYPSRCGPATQSLPSVISRSVRGATSSLQWCVTSFDTQGCRFILFLDEIHLGRKPRARLALSHLRQSVR